MFKYALLFCFVMYRGISIVGANLIHVAGRKGDNGTLPCQFKAKEVSQIVLNSWLEKVADCKNEKCDNVRAFKTGDCDIILMDLRLTDAGEYIMKIYYKNATVLERLIRSYHLYIEDEVSVKAGEEVKLDVLLPFVNKVEHQTQSSTEWMEIWSRRYGLQSDRLIISNGNLTISHFTDNYAGNYRVLDTDGQTMITLRLTESEKTLDNTDEGKSDETSQLNYGTESKGTQDNTDEGKSDETSQYSSVFITRMILSAGMILYAVLLTGTLIFLTIKC